MKKTFISLYILFFYSFFSGAQPLCTLKQYSISDGYTHGAVNDIIQDRNGLIWISTRDGLTQYDGYTFKTSKSYPGDGISMGTSNIGSINENSQGDIWCHNQDGRAYLFDPKTKKFYDILKNIETDEKKYGAITMIAPLKKGVTWLICKSGDCIRVDDKNCKLGLGIIPYQVKGKNIFRIYQDSDQDEWILTDKGFTIIGNKKLNDSTIYIHIAQQGNLLWLSDGRKKLGTFNPLTNKVDFVKLPPSMSRILLLKAIGQDSLAIGTTKTGVFIYDIPHSKFDQINVDVNPGTLNEVFSIYNDRIGDLWMSNRQPGIIHYEKKTRKVTILQSPTNEKFNYGNSCKYMVCEDKQGNIWTIPREGNLCYFNRDNQTLNYYYSKPGDNGSLISPLIRYYFVDKQGNIWFDNDMTLGKISYFDNDFTLIEKDEDEQEVRALLLDNKKNIWVGAKNGFLKILDKQNKCIGYVNQNGTVSKNPVSFNANVYAMLQDKQGNIWIGTRNNGIFLFLPTMPSEYKFAVQHFVSDSNNQYSLNNNNIYSFTQDSKGRIWVGTYGGGINLVEMQSDSLIRFINCSNRLKQYPMKQAASVRYILEDVNNNMLIATTNGLVSFSGSFVSTEDINFYFNTRRPNDATSLTNNDIFFICTDKQNNTFALVRNGGINRIISSTCLDHNLQFESITERDGLMSDLTLSMIEDKKGGLWLISKQGLSKYDPIQHKIDHYSGSIFRQNIVFSEAAPILNAEGQIIMGTNKGVLIFDPYKNNGRSYSPKIIFTRLNLQGVPLENAIENIDSLVMNPNQRNISIQFAALDFRDSKDIQYAYKLEGIDADWSYSGRDRSASYINLSHGSYQFKVKSTNSEGIWVDNVRTLSIIVKPQFIETIWAWIIFSFLLLIIISGIAYALFTYYRLKHAVIMEHQLSDLKLNFFTEVSHELRTPLTLITSPIAEIIETEALSTTAREHLTIVKKNTDRMLHLVNQILDFNKIQHKKMRLLIEKTEIVAFVKQIMESFKLYAIEKKITFTLDSGIDDLFIWIDKDKVEKIIFNLLSNAFKFTPNGKSIIVHLMSENNYAIISIVDQGIGISPKKMETLFQRYETLVNKDVLRISSGIGLSLVKELVELHHGKIEVKSQPEEGSEFKVSIRLGKQHYSGNANIDYVPENENQHTLLIPETEIKNINTENIDSDNEKWSIVIVEDNPELRKFLNDILSFEYTVIEADNGADGLEKILTVMPDIIVSDIMMPIMDGLEMVKQIKNNRDLCHIPIILLSAKGSLDDRISGLEKGIDDYIAKPFSATYLRTRIRTLIEQRKTLQDFYLSTSTPGNRAKQNINLSPTLPQISSFDSIFIQQLMDFMEKNMDNSSLTVDDFVDEFSMSRAVFFKKMKTLLGITPVAYIQDMRIKRAKQIIDSGINSMADVAYSCGFSDPNYFAKCFKKHLGLSPSEYKNSRT